MKPTRNSRSILALALAMCLAACLAVGAIAAGSYQDVTAQMSYGITVNYNGEAQQFTDVNGKAVYPLVYEGTTYLPVRAVAGLFDLPVDWNGATQTVYLGNKDKTPVTAQMVGQNDFYRWTMDPELLTINGKSHNSGFRFTAESNMSHLPSGEITVSGDYKTLTLLAYNPNEVDIVFDIYDGVTGTLLKKVSLPAGSPAKLVNANITDMTYVRIGHVDDGRSDNDTTTTTLILTDIYLQ